MSDVHGEDVTATEGVSALRSHVCEDCGSSYASAHGLAFHRRAVDGHGIMRVRGDGTQVSVSPQMAVENASAVASPALRDVCRWADAFDAYYEAEAVAVPNEPSFQAYLDVSAATWPSRWEAHRSVADICRLVRDQLSLAGGHAPEPTYFGRQFQGDPS